MKHAYLIMAHNNFWQLGVLLSLLDDVRNDLYLHVDSSASLFDEAYIRSQVHCSQLTVMPRTKVTWGGYSLIECQINLLETALEQKHCYYHLISGSDLPLKTNDEIYAFFTKFRGKEFVHFTACRDTGNMVTADVRRIGTYHPLQDILGRTCIKINPLWESIQELVGINRLKNLRLKNYLGKGSNWFSITHEFAQYLVQRKQEIRQVFSSGYCADELVMQTLILSSPFKDAIYRPSADNNYASIMRYMDWERGKPYVFRKEDFDNLIDSGMMFARKFDESVDSVIIKKVAEYLRDKKKK